MKTTNLVLLILHFLGLALGFTVSFANIVMAGLIAKAAPAEKVVLGRFPLAVGKLGRVGLALLWITGATMVFTRYGGFAALPWQFHVKLAAVVLLTITTEYIHWLQRRMSRGDATAGARIESVGRVTTSLALTALVFAVLAFH